MQDTPRGQETRPLCLSVLAVHGDGNRGVTSTLWGSARERAHAACAESGSGRAESPLVMPLPEPAREGRDTIFPCPNLDSEGEKFSEDPYLRVLFYLRTQERINKVTNN